jgi:hypothetical protein
MRENLEQLKLSELKALAQELQISLETVRAAGDLRQRETWLDTILEKMTTLSPKLAEAPTPTEEPNCHTTTTKESASQPSSSSCNWHTQGIPINSTFPGKRKFSQTYLVGRLIETCARIRGVYPQLQPVLIPYHKPGAYRFRLDIPATKFACLVGHPALKNGVLQDPPAGHYYVGSDDRNLPVAIGETPQAYQAWIPRKTSVPDLPQRFGIPIEEKEFNLIEGQLIPNGVPVTLAQKVSACAYAGAWADAFDLIKEHQAGTRILKRIEEIFHEKQAQQL